MRLAIVLSAVALASALDASTASAQGSNFAMVDSAAPARSPGWTFTPALGYQGAWDDNALLLFDPAAPADFQSVISPRANVNYLGRQSEFDASYDGGFIFYRDLNSLNSYDQHASVTGRLRLTPHLVVWANNGFAAVPTTELLNFVAVPFVRSGSNFEDFRGGVEMALTKFTTMTAAYNFQWVTFGEATPGAVLLLRGGHSNGGSASVKHGLDDSTSLIASFNLQHAFVNNGGTFDVQNGDVGVEHRLFSETRVFGAFGYSHLNVTQFSPARTGPAWRAGITHQLRRTGISASYSRSYVPAFGFGGTFQNEELTGEVHTQVTRRVYVQSSVAWRRNEPLLADSLRLRSFWLESTVGYELQPWVRVEGFFSGVHQEIDRPGGTVGRKRVGFQIVTSKPLRIR
jgi:hypothetical protein